MSGKNVEVSVYTEYPNIGTLPTVALRAKQTHVKVNSGGCWFRITPGPRDVWS